MAGSVCASLTFMYPKLYAYPYVVVLALRLHDREARRRGRVDVRRGRVGRGARHVRQVDIVHLEHELAEDVEDLLCQPVRDVRVAREAIRRLVAVRRAQRAYDKIDRWCEIGRYECAKGVEEANTYLHPYAINWSDERQQIYYLSRKEQAKVRRWWHRMRAYGLRRPRRSYDVLGDMERAQATVSAGVAACVESLVQEVERACKPAPKVPSPPRVRTTRKRGQK